MIETRNNMGPGSGNQTRPSAGTNRPPGGYKYYGSGNQDNSKPSIPAWKQALIDKKEKAEKKPKGDLDSSDEEDYSAPKQMQQQQRVMRQKPKGPSMVVAGGYVLPMASIAPEKKAPEKEKKSWLSGSTQVVKKFTKRGSAHASYGIKAENEPIPAPVVSLPPQPSPPQQERLYGRRATESNVSIAQSRFDESQQQQLPNDHSPQSPPKLPRRVASAGLSPKDAESTPPPSTVTARLIMDEASIRVHEATSPSQERQARCPPSRSKSAQYEMNDSSQKRQTRGIPPRKKSAQFEGNEELLEELGQTLQIGSQKQPQRQGSFRSSKGDKFRNREAAFAIQQMMNSGGGGGEVENAAAPVRPQSLSRKGSKRRVSGGDGEDEDDSLDRRSSHSSSRSERSKLKRSTSSSGDRTFGGLGDKLAGLGGNRKNSNGFDADCQSLPNTPSTHERTSGRMQRRGTADHMSHSQSGGDQTDGSSRRASRRKTADHMSHSQSGGDEIDGSSRRGARRSDSRSRVRKQFSLKGGGSQSEDDDADEIICSDVDSSDDSGSGDESRRRRTNRDGRGRRNRQTKIDESWSEYENESLADSNSDNSDDDCSVDSNDSDAISVGSSQSKAMHWDDSESEYESDFTDVVDVIAKSPYAKKASASALFNGADRLSKEARNIGRVGGHTDSFLLGDDDSDGDDDISFVESPTGKPNRRDADRAKSARDGHKSKRRISSNSPSKKHSSRDRKHRSKKSSRSKDEDKKSRKHRSSKSRKKDVSKSGSRRDLQSSRRLSVSDSDDDSVSSHDASESIVSLGDDSQEGGDQCRRHKSRSRRDDDNSEDEKKDHRHRLKHSMSFSHLSSGDKLRSARRDKDERKRLMRSQSVLFDERKVSDDRQSRRGSKRSSSKSSSLKRSNTDDGLLERRKSRSSSKHGIRRTKSADDDDLGRSKSRSGGKRRSKRSDKKSDVRQLIELLEKSPWGARALIEESPSLAEAKDKKGCLPLHLAAGLKRLPVDILEKLIEAYPGACDEQCDRRGFTPLHYAVRCNLPTANIKALIKASPAALKTQDRKGQIPLHVAVSEKIDIKSIRLLVFVYPESTGIENYRGETVLKVARKKNVSEDIMRELKAPSK